MERPLHAQPHKSTVALVRWSKKPGENPVIRFIILTVFGLILCLFLMIFMPGLRSGGAVALFTVSFAALLTIPAVSGQRTFMRGLTQRVNDTIAEVSDSPGDQLSVGEFRRLIKSGEPLPLLVGGVPGLSLHVERVATAEENARRNGWRSLLWSRRRTAPQVSIGWLPQPSTPTAASPALPAPILPKLRGRGSGPWRTRPAPRAGGSRQSC